MLRIDIFPHHFQIAFCSLTVPSCVDFRFGDRPLNRVSTTAQRPIQEGRLVNQQDQRQGNDSHAENGDPLNMESIMDLQHVLATFKVREAIAPAD